MQPAPFRPTSPDSDRAAPFRGLLSTVCMAAAFAFSAAAAGTAPVALADHHEEDAARPQPAEAADSTEASTLRTEQVLVLRDGRRVQGRLVGRDDELVTLRTAGVVRAYRVADVERFEEVSVPVPVEIPSGSADTGSATDAAPVDKAAKQAERKRNKGAETLSEPASLWLAQLVRRVADTTGERDPAVEKSVAAAVRALGPAAAPRLRAAAADAAPDVRRRLERLAQEAERSRRDNRLERRRTAATDPFKTFRDAVGLTDEEAATLGPLLRSYREEIGGLRKARRAGTLDRAALKTAVADAREELRVDLLDAFGPERARQLGEGLAEMLRGRPGSGVKRRKKPPQPTD